MNLKAMAASLALGFATLSGTAIAGDAPAAAAHYSSKTTALSALLADPAAKAVLVKHLPQMMGNADVAERAGGMTLTEIAEAVKTYAPGMLTEEVLAKIDTDLAALPVH